MKRRLLTSCAVIALVFGVGGVWAQDAPPEDPAASTSPILDSEVDVSEIDNILRGEEELLAGGIFGYDPAGRRDPFRSLMGGMQEELEGPAQARPPGLPGMLIEELKLEGIIQTPSGILAFILGRDNVSYIIRPGTKLYDGEVAEIQLKKVVFRRNVNDPNRIKEYDEIVREFTD